MGAEGSEQFLIQLRIASPYGEFSTAQGIHGNGLKEPSAHFQDQFSSGPRIERWRHRFEIRSIQDRALSPEAQQVRTAWRKWWLGRRYLFSVKCVRFGLPIGILCAVYHCNAWRHGMTEK